MELTIKQRIINGLSFDINHFFISNKSLTKETKELLKNCNVPETRGVTNGPTYALSKAFHEHGLPIIREVLTNGFLITNLDPWKRNLLSETGIITSFVNYYQSKPDQRKWILLELSKFSNSNFESIRCFVQAFFMKLIGKKDLVKDILSEKGLSSEIYKYTFISLSYTLATNGKKEQPNLKGLDKQFDVGPFPKEFKAYYLYLFGGDGERVEEIKRIIQTLIDFIVDESNHKKQEVLIKELLSVFRRYNEPAHKYLFAKLSIKRPERTDLFAQYFSDSFVNWSEHTNLINVYFQHFIIAAFKSSIPVKTKKKLLEVYRNKDFQLEYEDSSKTRNLTPKEKVSKLRKLIRDKHASLEHDLKIEINEYIGRSNTKTRKSRNNASTPFSERDVPELQANVYALLIDSILNSRFEAAFKTLNNTTKTLDFLAYARRNTSEAFQERLTEFLKFEWTDEKQ